jgi:hypothetical protein
LRGAGLTIHLDATCGPGAELGAKWSRDWRAAGLATVMFPAF